MESNEWRFGWAADDPRWDDAQAGGNGRLEPAPPTFGPSGGAAVAEEPSLWPTDWPSTGPAGPNYPEPPDPRLAIGSSQLDEPAGTAIGAASVPGALPLPAAGFASPAGRREAGQYPDAGPYPDDGLPAPLLPGLGLPAGVRTGYGLMVRGGLLEAGGATGTGAVGDVSAGALDHRPTSTGQLAEGRPTRLERQVRLRRRRGADDEFYQATRAELLSDDARYKVLFALTAGWYAPVAVLYVVWAVVTGGGSILAGLGWLVGGAVLALAIAGLLRWAQVSWRALTLSLAAAVIGGAVATLAHTLSS